MPTRIDYLRDLRLNPGATAEQVLSRVRAPTLAAVETFLRKAATANLVARDDSNSKRYKLTEAGAEELGNLELHSGPRRETSDAQNDPDGQGKALGRITVLRERVKQLDSGIDSLTKERSASVEPRVTCEDIEALYRAQHESHSFNWANRLFNDDVEVRRRVADLEAKLPSSITEQVARLVQLERKLYDDSWSGDCGRVLRGVLELREALKFPPNLCSLVKGDSSQENAESEELEHDGNKNDVGNSRRGWW